MRWPTLPRWPLWSLPLRLRCFVLAVCAGWLLAVPFSVFSTAFRVGDLAVCLLLLGCAAASIEVTRRFGEPAGVVWRDMLGVWTVPVLLLLPSAYALLAPLPLQLLSQWRVRRSLPHRVCFSVAAIGLSGWPVALLFHVLAGPSPRDRPFDVGLWLVLGAAAALLRAALNLLLVSCAVRFSDPAARWRALLLNQDGLFLEAAQASAGLTVTTICLLSPWLAPLTLPAMLLLLGRSAMTAQLRAVARTDPKTGLLNAAAWEREAAVAVARAVRDQRPLAVLLLDLDHFKKVNDTYGHLAGDAVLRAVASVLSSSVRDGDLAGRFGGEEFSVLLPGAEPVEAQETAERLRKAIAAISIPHGPSTIQVTASIGVASLRKPRVEVTDLVAAADHALYICKDNGRNQTRLTTLGP